MILIQLHQSVRPLRVRKPKNCAQFGHRISLRAVSRSVFMESDHVFSLSETQRDILKQSNPVSKQQFQSC